MEPPANQDVHMSLQYDFGTINAVRVIEIQCIDCQPRVGIYVTEYVCCYTSASILAKHHVAPSLEKGPILQSRGVRGVVGSEDCCLLQQVNHGQKEMRWICTS